MRAKDKVKENIKDGAILLFGRNFGELHRALISFNSANDAAHIPT